MGRRSSRSTEAVWHGECEGITIYKRSQVFNSKLAIKLDFFDSKYCSPFATGINEKIDCIDLNYKDTL